MIWRQPVGGVTFKRVTARPPWDDCLRAGQINERFVSMAETSPRNRKLIPMGVGAVASLLLCLRINAPLGMWIYTGIGVLVAGFWFWDDRAPDKAMRWDIAVAFPILGLLWPLIALMLPFRKHFRDPQ
jgi:hypothetical protein